MTAPKTIMIPIIVATVPEELRPGQKKLKHAEILIKVVSTDQRVPALSRGIAPSRTMLTTWAFQQRGSHHFIGHGQR